MNPFRGNPLTPHSIAGMLPGETSFQLKTIPILPG